MVSNGSGSSGRSCTSTAGSGGECGSRYIVSSRGSRGSSYAGCGGGGSSCCFGSGRSCIIRVVVAVVITVLVE